MPFCETCGVEGGGDYCPACGEVRSFAAKAVAAGEAARRPGALQAAAAVPLAVAGPHHGVPALMSFFIPGLGQLVKGHVAKGLGTWGAMMCLGVAGFVVEYAFIAIPAIWVWGIYDAYKSNTPKVGLGGM